MRYIFEVGWPNYNTTFYFQKTYRKIGLVLAGNLKATFKRKNVGRNTLFGSDFSHTKIALDCVVLVRMNRYRLHVMCYRLAEFRLVLNLCVFIYPVRSFTDEHGYLY